MPASSNPTQSTFPPTHPFQPDKRPRSPMTNDLLRVKDLLPLPVMVDPEWKVGGWVGGERELQPRLS